MITDKTLYIRNKKCKKKAVRFIYYYTDKTSSIMKKYYCQCFKENCRSSSINYLRDATSMVARSFDMCDDKTPVVTRTNIVMKKFQQ